MERNDFMVYLYYLKRGGGIRHVEWDDSKSHDDLDCIYLYLTRDRYIKVTLTGELTADWKEGLDLSQ